jgi:hypothetical protein
LSKLPHHGIFAKGLSCCFWLPPVNHIWAKGKTGLHSDNMWSDSEYVVCYIGGIGVLWGCFLLMAPPIGYVRYPKCTACHHWVGVVINEIWINLSQVR